jgi:hypothetical protein
MRPEDTPAKGSQQDTPRRAQPLQDRPQQDSRRAGERSPPQLPRAPSRQGRPRRAPDVRPDYNRLRWVYCVRRDDELIALRLEAMTPPELADVSRKLLARGAHTEAAELVAWMRGSAS